MTERETASVQGEGLEDEFEREQRVHEHARRTGPTIGGEDAVPAIRAALKAEATVPAPSDEAVE